jgi:glyoxylase-like metal-dependent hydrolase (beta-lactamase superfamily II)
VTTGNEKSATSKNEQRDYLFEQVRVPRGCLGYIIADTETRLAAIVDPELEMVEPMIDLVFKHGLRVAYVIDSHTHADHVSGARDLKSKTIAKLVMHEEAPSGAVDIRIEDGDRLHLGSLPLKFLHTPGHAKDLVSILLPGRILTADALLIGSCGRTDLLNGSAIRQYHTLYHTYKSLPDELGVWPGHDYKGRSSSTLSDEKRNNQKMLFDSEEEFVEFMDLENPKRLDPVEHLAESLKVNMK